ncbi:MAG: hypothetical protein LBC02_00970 [Planctomycetaceae bacterium]|jgi:hypothetical protein|nr:hypothetical protein [Planctomycetaceae bacterium]
MDREHLKLLSDVEQSSEFLTQNLPPLWWGIYQKCLDVGFTEELALSLTKQYIHSSLTQIRNLGDYNAD